MVRREIKWTVKAVHMGKANYTLNLEATRTLHVLQDYIATHMSTCVHVRVCACISSIMRTSFDLELVL